MVALKINRGRFDIHFAIMAVVLRAKIETGKVEVGVVIALDLDLLSAIALDLEIVSVIEEMSDIDTETGTGDGLEFHLHF